MKIIAFSDIHGQMSRKLDKWFKNNPADILLFAGDMQGSDLMDDIRNFMAWIHSLPYPEKLLTFGNHDSQFEIALAEEEKYKDITILNEDGAIINGIKIYGSPYSVEFGNWWFMLPDSELEEIYRHIPEDINILITHSPAYGILDTNIFGEHCGSKSLAARIPQFKKLKYHVHGHIHEGYGQVKINNVTHINCSVLNELYQMTNNPTIIENY